MWATLEDLENMDLAYAPPFSTAIHPFTHTVNGELDHIKKDEKLLLVCTKGRRAYLLQNRLKFFGYKNTFVLEGGTIFNGSEL